MLRYQSNKLIVLSVFLLAITTDITTLAQGQNEEVTIIAPYKPTLSESFKINVNPSIPDQKVEFPTLQYSIQPFRANTLITPQPIDANKKPPELRKSLKRNFLRAGFGNYITSYFEFFVNSLQSEEHAIGLHLKHISSLGEIKNYANSSYSNNYANVFATKFLKNHSLGAKITYTRDVFHYYGYKPDDFPAINLSKDDIKHRIQIVEGGIDFKSTFTSNTAVDHGISLDYYFLSDNYKSNEQVISAKAMLGKRFEMLDLTEYQVLGIDVAVDYFSNSDTIDSYSGTLFTVTPFMSTDFNQYRFYVGLDLSYKSDSSAEFHFFPIVKAEVSMIKDVLAAFVEINGTYERVTYRSLSSENPFILPIVPLNYQKNQFTLAAGLLGNISDKVNFLITVSNSKIKHLPLFVTDTNTLNNTFTVIYDNANVFHVKAQINHTTTEKFNIGLNAEYFNYSTSNEKKAWYKPSIKLGLIAEYVIQEKFIIGAEIIASGPMYAKVYEQKQFVEKTIDSWVDLNLSFNYQITENFSTFLNVNNILNRNYQKWYNYPTQKFNVLAGIGFAF